MALLDATAQAELISSGEASSEELVEASIANIEELNPQVNAVIHELFEEGREASRGDIPDGPFRGVPFVIKDLGAAFAGQPLHLGTRFLKEAGFQVPVDTTLAQRFRQAGFITIAKTNTPEFGILPTTEPVAYGPSRNPWNTDYSTGGSSGGSGAAVACGMVPVAHANDGGGSIRIPASECGLFGLKPTRQRISEGPLVGDIMSGLTVELVVSKSVRDTAAILEAVHGAAPGDPYVAPAPERPYTEEMGADPGKLRIALWTESLATEETHPEAVAAAEEAGRMLESLGHTVEPLDMSIFGGIDLIDSFTIRWTCGQAASLDQFGTLLGRELGPEDMEPLTWALAEVGRTFTGGQYLNAVGQHQAAGRLIAGLHETYDLLLSPTLGAPPPRIGHFDQSGPDPLDAFRSAEIYGAFTAIFNATGAPAVSLPLHHNEAGLPIGVQLAAPYGREDLLIRISSQIEEAHPWADRVAPVFAG